jgi:uncharacterized membrane protein YcfT
MGSMSSSIANHTVNAFSKSLGHQMQLILYLVDLSHLLEQILIVVESPLPLFLDLSSALRFHIKERFNFIKSAL